MEKISKKNKVKKQAKKQRKATKAKPKKNRKSQSKISRVWNNIHNIFKPNDWANKEDILLDIPPITTTDGNELNVDLNSCIDISLKLGSNKLTAKPEKQIVPVLLNLKEINFEQNDIEIDAKIDLICLIDISGSMNGKRIDYVRKTLIELLPFLEGGHRLSIVLFDDEAERIMNFKLVNESTIVQISEIINSIKVRGSTNITAGIKLSQKLLGLRETKNHISCIFLLSDGYHNVGQISKTILYNNDINLTKCEYTISSFGYGDDHDAELLQMISDNKGGSYFYINEVSQIEQCFTDCLAMITSIIGQNVRGTIALNSSELFPNIKFTKTFGNYWNDINDHHKDFSISSFYTGFDKSLVCQIELDAIAAGKVMEEMNVKIATLELKIDTVGSNSTSVVFTRELTITLMPSDFEGVIEEDTQVQKELLRVEGAELIQEAEELRKVGKHDNAVSSIKKYEKRLEMYKDDEVLCELNVAMNVQKNMILNEKLGKKNKMSFKHYAITSKNAYMNQQSEPLVCKSFKNRKQKKRTSKYN